MKRKRTILREQARKGEIELTINEGPGAKVVVTLDGILITGHTRGRRLEVRK